MERGKSQAKVVQRRHLRGGRARRRPWIGEHTRKAAGSYAGGGGGARATAREGAPAATGGGTPATRRGECWAATGGGS
jgi:hypothetical protein